MKLYVWKDVLCDWTCGLIVALAPDLETALKLIDEDWVRREMGANFPEVVDLGPLGPVLEPRAWWVSGGG